MMRTIRRALGAAMAAAALVAPGAAADQQATAVGTGGAASTADEHATRAAIEIMRAGGNATDAAVAAAATLGVVEPFSCGVGGGGFWISYDRSSQDVSTIDSRETAPRAMRPDSFFENGASLAFNDARWSGLSVGVPGTVASWVRALHRSGTMTLRQVLQPAIRVAKRGFLVDQTFFNEVQKDQPWFDDVPSTRALYLDADGTPRDIGERIRNLDLAKTYEVLAEQGEHGFYRGPVAKAVAAAAENPPIDSQADHVWRHGLLTTSDLRDYSTVVRSPTRIGYRGLDVYGMGPPSSGGSTIGEIMNILEGFQPIGADRPDALHRFIEASRLAFADRNAYVADPAYFDVPLRGLLSDHFAAERRALIPDTAGTGAVPPGDPYDEDRSSGPAGSARVSREGTSTTNLTVADTHGNVVDYTFTIESTGGSGIVVPGYGFLLNNELTDFNYDSTTHPNRADSGKRPRSSMGPTIVLDHGRPFLALGSPGGATIITTVSQILLDRLDLGMTLPDAIAAPRVSQRGSATTQVEPGFASTPDGQALAARGHKFTVSNDEFGGLIGDATAIEFRSGGKLLAAAEPVRRGGGSAMVVQP